MGKGTYVFSYSSGNATNLFTSRTNVPEMFVWRYLGLTFTPRRPGPAEGPSGARWRGKGRKAGVQQAMGRNETQRKLEQERGKTS